MNVSETLVQAALLGEAVDGSDAAVFVADESMRYVAVNQRACDGLGYTRAELLGLRVGDVAKYGDAPDEFQEVVAHGGRVGSAELTRKDGTSVLFRYRASETTVAGMAMFVSIGDFDES